MFRKQFPLKIEKEQQEPIVFNPVKQDEKSEFKSHIQKSKKKLKSAIISSPNTI